LAGWKWLAGAAAEPASKPAPAAHRHTQGHPVQGRRVGGCWRRPAQPASPAVSSKPNSLKLDSADKLDSHQQISTIKT